MACVSLAIQIRDPHRVAFLTRPTQKTWSAEREMGQQCMSCGHRTSRMAVFTLSLVVAAIDCVVAQWWNVGWLLLLATPFLTQHPFPQACQISPHLLPAPTHANQRTRTSRGSAGRPSVRGVRSRRVRRRPRGPTLRRRRRRLSWPPSPGQRVRVALGSARASTTTTRSRLMERTCRRARRRPAASTRRAAPSLSVISNCRLWPA